MSNKNEFSEIKNIYLDEPHHRKRLNEMLVDMQAQPKVHLEILFFCIGFVIGSLCLFGGWFIPMYGAGKLESTNIFENEDAARLASISGQHDIVDELIEFAEIEWDHGLYFRNKAESHFLYSLFPKWNIPKEKIKSKMTLITSKISTHKFIHRHQTTFQTWLFVFRGKKYVTTTDSDSNEYCSHLEDS